MHHVSYSYSAMVWVKQRMIIQSAALSYLRCTFTITVQMQTLETNTYGKEFSTIPLLSMTSIYEGPTFIEVV